MNLIANFQKIAFGFQFIFHAPGICYKTRSTDRSHAMRKANALKHHQQKMRGLVCRRQRPINGEEKKDNTGNRRGKRVEAQSDAHGEAKRAGSFVPVAQRRLALMQFDLKGR